MAEPFTIGGIIAATLLFSPAAREQERLKTIAYTASKYHKSPEAARSAFFRMANPQDPQAQSVDRVDSLPAAHVRPNSPMQPGDNFAQNPIPVVPDVHRQAEERDEPGESPHNQDSGQKSLIPRYLPDHCRQVIDKRWTAKKATKDARYRKQCDKLDHKYGAAESKRNRRQQRLDDRHRKAMKSLELKRCMDMSMGEWRARRQAEKKSRSTKNAAPAQVHASTDGTGESQSRHRKTRSRTLSHCRLTRDSSSDRIFSFTEGSWQPTTLTTMAV